MSSPSFLVFEIRAAFRCSALQHVATRRCPYSTTARLLARSPPKKSSLPQKRDVPEGNDARLPARLSADIQQQPQHHPSNRSSNTSKDLIPEQPRRTSLDTGREVTIPTKVLPKAAIAPNINLSPMQRLHIEHLTRHPPPKKPQKPFKERLLVYNISTTKVTALVFFRILAIAGAGFMTVVWLPAYYLHSTLPIYTLPFIWLSSFIPILAMNYLTRSVITEAFLNLPNQAARKSPQAAINYAKNLPRDASLQVRFLRWTGITGMMKIFISDIQPVTSTKWYKVANFKVPLTPSIKAESSFLKPALTEFFVHSKTARGRSARDTIPGLWDVVYKRLTGIEPSAVPRWKR